MAKAITDNPTRMRAALLGLAAVAVILGFAQGAHEANAAAGIGYADSYWTQFWLTSYQDGYVRRSLLGSVLSLLVPAGSSIAIVAGFQIAVSVASIVLVLWLGARAAAAFAGARAIVPTVLLLAISPIPAMFFETTGDPLQIVMLVWIGALALAVRTDRRRNQLAILIAAIAVCAMLHEASVFFVIPALLLHLARGSRLHGLIVVAIVAGVTCLVAGVISLSVSSSSGVPSYFLTNMLDGTAIRASSDATPGFAAVFRQEMHDSFGSIEATARFAARLLRFALVPLGLMAFLFSFRRRAIHLAVGYAAIVLSCAPLFAIAHDWGRFGIVILVMVLSLAVYSPFALVLRNKGLVGKIGRIGSRIMRHPNEESIARILLVSLVSSSLIVWDDYRVAGGRPALVVTLVLAIAASAAYLRSTKRSFHEQGLPSTTM